MSSLSLQKLAPGYTAEVDCVDEPTWCQLLQEFDDANIYQTWSYAAVISGRRHMSHLLLRRDGVVVAIAQARITKLPFLNLGIAYVQWGPLCRLRGTKEDPDVFPQAARALRNEYVCKRGLTLRLFPNAFAGPSSRSASELRQERFFPLASATPGRTILMGLGPSLQDLRQAAGGNFKRNLKATERNKLEIMEGPQDALFEQFVGMYKEMVSRKKFEEPNDINQFRQIQLQLPDPLKMRVMLCLSNGSVCAGAIYSAMGDTAVYLFGATSNVGLKASGSYLVQWNIVEALKEKRIAIYNLNGINPSTNPGTYKFKKDLAGKNGQDVYYLGRLDAHPNAISRFCVELGDALKTKIRKFKKHAKSDSYSNPSTKATNVNSGSRELAPPPKPPDLLESVVHDRG